MRTYILGIATAALFVLPTSAFSQVDVEVGPGGVQVRPGYHRHYDDGYHRGDRYGGGRCRELRPRRWTASFAISLQIATPKRSDCAARLGRAEP